MEKIKHRVIGLDLWSKDLGKNDAKKKNGKEVAGVGEKDEDRKERYDWKKEGRTKNGKEVAGVGRRGCVWKWWRKNKKESKSNEMFEELTNHSQR